MSAQRSKKQCHETACSKVSASEKQCHAAPWLPPFLRIEPISGPQERAFVFRTKRTTHGSINTRKLRLFKYGVALQSPANVVRMGVTG